ncbi:MAG: DUF72 domain-containing protein [Deltaproteobacteria bacterium]|nr:DUF72 domain-containing protein [Deltaproteobacteria bacterium]
MKKLASHFIGTSGFAYEEWMNSFYPSVYPRKQWLSFYSQHFNSVEITTTFSKAPEKEVLLQWAAQTPVDFKFSLRGYHYVTHTKKLQGPAEPLKIFMDRARVLKEKLGCVIWKIPFLGSGLPKNLENFLKHLQKYPEAEHVFDFELDTRLSNRSELAKLVESYDARVAEREGFAEAAKLKKRFVYWDHELLDEEISSLKKNQDFYGYFLENPALEGIEHCIALYKELKK